MSKTIMARRGVTLIAALAAATGAILGTLPAGANKVFAQPVFAQGTLFVATESGGLYNLAPG